MILELKLYNYKATKIAILFKLKCIEFCLRNYLYVLDRELTKVNIRNQVFVFLFWEYES